MAKDRVEAGKIFRKFLFRCGIAALVELPVIGLIVWAEYYSNGALDEPTMEWPVRIIALLVLALQFWLWFWVFTQPLQELNSLPDLPRSKDVS